MRKLVLLMVIAAATVGCNRGHKFSKTELEKAQQALETCLESWKKGEMPQKLKGLPEPIDFAEEMPAAGYRLTEYQILGHENTDAETMRFSVKLTLQDQRGRSEEKQVTYGVALKSPIAVGRDPFF